jgi:hypothetical protein
MSWKNFEEDIVDEYRVVLEGWPSSTFNPAQIGYKGLEPILDALEEGVCKFHQLTDDEYAARKDRINAAGGSQKKKRKQRSDKGKRRGAHREGSDDGENNARLPTMSNS